MWTVINFFKRFVLDFFFSLKFTALEYDDKLKLTKTPRQRALIWIIIATVAIIVVYVILRFFAEMLFTIGRYNEKILTP